MSQPFDNAVSRTGPQAVAFSLGNSENSADCRGSYFLKKVLVRTDIKYRSSSP